MIIDVFSSRVCIAARYDDMYELYVTYSDGKTTREGSLIKSVANYFDEDGCLCRDIYDEDLMELHSSLLNVKKNN